MVGWLKQINPGDVVKRFPIVTAILAAFAVMLMIGDFHHEDLRFRLTVGLVLAAYIGVIITIIGEARQQGPGYVKQIIAIAIVLALAAAADMLKTNIFVLIIASTFLLGNAYLWRQMRDDVRTWNFTHLIWSGAVFATVGSILYALGIMAIYAALEVLFNVDIDELIEHLLFPVGFGFLAPMYWLSTVPKADEPADELLQNPSFVSRAIGFMGSYILAPLTLIYALILLAYGIKIAVEGELPKGEIAGLTTPFLIIGTLTWLLLEPPFIAKKWISKLFRSVWFYAMMPAVVLLAIATLVRIGNYGFTEERVYLLLAVLWGGAVALWFGIGPKAKRDIRIIPRLAAGVLIFGAFFALPLSLWHQSSLLPKTLAQAGLLNEDGKVGPQDSLRISDRQAAGRSRSIIEYLMRHDSYDSLSKLLEDPETMPALQDDSKNSYMISQEVLNRFGVGFVEGDYKATSIDPADIGNVARNISLYNLENRGKVMISGYDSMHFARTQDIDSVEKYTDGQYYFAFREDVILVYKNGDVIISGPVPFEKPLSNEHSQLRDQYVIDKPMVIGMDSAGKTYAIWPNSMMIGFDENGEFVRFSSASGYLFIANSQTEKGTTDE